MKLPQNGPDGPFLDWTNFSITLDKPGMFETLGVKPASRRPPGFGEVEIEVHSVALNFKEVLQALGVIPVSYTHLERRQLKRSAAPDLTRLPLGDDGPDAPTVHRSSAENQAPPTTASLHLERDRTRCV